MREVKYREWNEVEEKLEYKVFNKDLEITPSFSIGMKDREGNELYEGDIVFERYAGERALWQIKYDEREAAYFVKCLTYTENFYGEDMEEVLSESDVIGNIYQTPELLERDGSID